MKNITKLKFVIISISTIIGISIIITICAYSLISANSSQLALYIENLVPNFWTCRNGTIGRSLARFFFLMYSKYKFLFIFILIANYYIITLLSL